MIEREAATSKKAPSTTIDSEALHQRLAQLLKEEDFRAAQGEKRDPVSSHEKRAVYKAKGEVKRSNDLSRFFERDERQNTGPPQNSVQDFVPDVALRQLVEAMHLSKTVPADTTNKVLESTATSKRGFAEKMFAGAAIESTPCVEYCGDAQQPHVSFHQSLDSRPIDLMTATPQKDRRRPLPDNPSANPLIAAAQNGRKAEQIRPISPDALMAVSPAHHGHLRSYSWGSLGPPTHLEEAQENGTSPYHPSRAKKELEAWKLVEVMPQFGRSADLNVSIAASYVDSAAIVEESKADPRYSLTGSQVETLNRIHHWRAKSGGTASSSGLYAPSANATEPSVFFRGEKADQASSHLTSISRRGHALSRQKELVVINADKKREEPCPSDHSTVIGVEFNGDQNGKGRHPPSWKQTAMAQHMEEPIDASNKMKEKLVDVVSPPLSPPIGNGTKHIRQLSPDESRKLFELME